jgi:uncharacterized protein (DUF58 family)
MNRGVSQIAAGQATIMQFLHRLHESFYHGLWSRGMPPGVKLRLLVGWPLILLPALVFSQIVTPHPVWVVLLVTLVALYGAAYAWVRSQARVISFERRRQGAVLVAGDILREDFALINAGRLPVLWAEFVDASDLPNYAPGSVVACQAGGTYRWWKEVECARRGVFRLGPCSLRLGDPFGFFSSEHEYDRYETLLIYPRVVELPEVDLPRGSAGGTARRRRPLSGVLPAASVRDYAPGDSIRHIHWPTTAHRGQMMVKELELEPSGDVWIVLDLHAAVQRGEGRSGTLEHSIILAASMAAEMVSGRERRAVGLLTASADQVIALPPQPGQAQLWSIMAALAPAQPTDWSLAELLRRNQGAMGRRHTLIVITASAAAEDGGASWIAELVQAQRVGLASSVLLVTIPEDEARCSETVRQLIPLDIPAQVLRTDMLMRTALTYRRKRKVIRTTPTGGAYTIEVEEEVG